MSWMSDVMCQTPSRRSDFRRPLLSSCKKTTEVNVRSEGEHWLHAANNLSVHTVWSQHVKLLVQGWTGSPFRFSCLKACMKVWVIWYRSWNIYCNDAPKKRDFVWVQVRLCISVAANNPWELGILSNLEISSHGYKIIEQYSLYLSCQCFRAKTRSKEPRCWQQEERKIWNTGSFSIGRTQAQKAEKEAVH